MESGSAQLGSRLLLTQTDSSASDLGDNILLEDGSDVNVNQSVTKDTYTSLGYSTNNFTRDSLVNISDENSVDTIVLEGQDIGTFKLEDGSTVTGTFGDDILLEDSTGFGVGEKLRLEKTFIALEDSINVGANPFDMAGDTILEPFTIPSDIFVTQNGKLTHEDGDDFIVYDTSADENDQIILEDGTDLDLYTQTINNGVSLELGFSGELFTFDNNVKSFDVLKV